jgi:hypothetical protein
MLPRVKGHQKLEEAGKVLLPEALARAPPADTLISGPWLPELLENKSLLFEVTLPVVLCYAGLKKVICLVWGECMFLVSKDVVWAPNVN